MPRNLKINLDTGFHKSRSCQSKRRYKTKNAAKKFIRWMIGQGLAPNQKPYECPFCGGWHLTTKEIIKNERPTA